MTKLGELNFEIKMRGKCSGSLNEPIVIPSPGWGIECELKFAELEPFFDDRCFLCMVVRGTYPSDRPSKDSDITSTEMAKDLDLSRQAIGLHRLSLYAHSIGCTIALAYAEFFPERVSNLALVHSRLLDYDDTPTLIRVKPSAASECGE